MDDEFEVLPLRNDLVCDAFRDRKVVKDPKILTKSKFLNGLQCPKLLWTRCNAPETIPAASESLQRVFDTGHQIGELATRRFPGGVHVQEDNFLKNIEETKVLLASKTPRPIYEAGVKAGRLYARADILVPSPQENGVWDIVEVKCGTDVKDVYLQDIAFQRYCYEHDGIKIGRCYLMYVNNQYVRSGAINVDEFFTLQDVTIDIEPFMQVMSGFVDGFLKIIDLPACPNTGIREHCGKPYECQMKPLCWAFLPKDHVLELSRGKAKGFDLLEQGISRLVDIPYSFKLTDNQSIQKECAITGKAYADRGEIETFLKTLRYPLWHMDFETIFEPIPRFDGVRPYQQVPFQFSVHLEKAPGAPLEHFEFLHKDATDPRKAFIKALRACLGSEGTVLAWNMGFEKGRLKEIGDAFPEHADWCADVNTRTEDLLIPFRKFFYYHPAQHGSASLKKVLPALMGKGYEGMVIGDGGTATTEYARVTYGEGVDPGDRAKVYEALEVYCGLDTKAMVDILGRLMTLLE